MARRPGILVTPDSVRDGALRIVLPGLESELEFGASFTLSAKGRPSGATIEYEVVAAGETDQEGSFAIPGSVVLDVPEGDLEEFLVSIANGGKTAIVVLNISGTSHLGWLFEGVVYYLVPPSITPSPGWSDGSWSDAGTWDDNTTWQEAA